jgi:hypothetical protein
MKPDHPAETYPTDEVKRRWGASLPLPKELPTTTPRAPLIPLPKAPEATGLSRSEIYRAAGRGELDIRKIGRSSYLTTESVLRYVQALPKAKIGKGRTP